MIVSKPDTMNPVAVMAAARTPFAKAFTELSKVSAVELGKIALLGAVGHSGLRLDDVDEVIFGNVAGPADSANIARVIALSSGVPQDRIAHTVNRNCASGIESLLAGCQSLNSRRAGLVVAGGTESMSQIPLLFRPAAARRMMKLARARSWREKLRVLVSLRPADFKPVVGIELGLTDPVSGLNMGETAEVLAKEFAITRDQQDAFAMDSHVKAEAAQTRCFLSGEIVPVPESTAGMDRPFAKDNAIRYGQSMQSLAKLRPIFDPAGSVTAGNSCPLTDGAAAVVMAREDEVVRFGTSPLGYIVDYAVAGCDPRRMGLGPVYATAKLLDQRGWSLSDFDLIEINEAFAAQVIACERAFESKQFAERELGRGNAVGTIDRSKLNVHGGAIALGHPVGTTGTRLILTMMRALRESGGNRGLVTLCVGGGQGVAVAIEVRS
ncbi:Acetyl-CoA acetyltransferase [Rubripirellula lacrimiformis]|uniref:Acetyl-CoA acetyltransferase n=1 Tax=Rubripirellula lacrimiformis TaxID=1930273 RepID=A0A517N917_9BACT|nr:thiolase family protein [Rubripirellula lacrimiformis]QDT03635.1 Acetyl-CoA acetyltransferase [Rubripirellula lacrimiformis]